jgi:NAD(P)-dependent dehydrogenase (short-subunit alcohol dehydrogenase family)
MELEGKIALVTGAGGGGPGGMGKGIAMVFAREGADIAVNDIDQKLAETVAEELWGAGQWLLSPMSRRKKRSSGW